MNTDHSPEVVAYLNTLFPDLLGSRCPAELRAIAPVWEPVARSVAGEGPRSCTYRLANRDAFFFRAKFCEADTFLSDWPAVDHVTIGRDAAGVLNLWAC